MKLRQIKLLILHKIKWWVSALIGCFASGENNFCLAKDPQIKNQLFKFRFAIYHDEFYREVEGLDLQLKVINDLNDEEKNTFLFYRKKGEEVIATLRVIVWTPGTMPNEIKKFYEIDEYNWLDFYTVCEFGRLMVKKECRSKLITLKFLAAIIRFVAFKQKVQFIFLSCKPHLVPRYNFLGFHSYTSHVINYPDGIEVPLAFLVDGNYLKRVKSPGKFLLRKMNSISPEDIAAFGKNSESAVMLNKNEIWPVLEKSLKSIGGFTEEEIDVFNKLVQLDCFLLTVTKSVELVHLKMVDSTMYLVVEGTVEVELKDHSRYIVGAGNLVGEFSYFLPDHKRTAKVGIHQGRLFVIKDSAIRILGKIDHKKNEVFLHLIIRNLIHKVLNCR
jgi:predicted GNAT family N-acyltransferase